MLAELFINNNSELVSGSARSRSLSQQGSNRYAYTADLYKCTMYQAPFISTVFSRRIITTACSEKVQGMGAIDGKGCHCCARLRGRADPDTFSCDPAIIRNRARLDTGKSAVRKYGVMTLPWQGSPGILPVRQTHAQYPPRPADTASGLF